MLATVPAAVREKTARLSADLQAKFGARIDAMRVLAHAPRSQWRTTAKRLEAELTLVHGRGFSAKNLLNLFRSFRREGEAALVFEYGKGAATPEAFLDFLQARVETNKRVASVELENIVAEWRAGAAIPGFGTWQQAWTMEFPDDPLPIHCPEWFSLRGFSPRNLRRKLAGPAQTEFARRGFFDAHGKLPQLRCDYRGLRPLELVVFDDVKLDWLVSVPGYSRPCEIWLLVARDAATRVYLDWIVWVVVPDAEDGHKKSLCYEHMRILCGQLLLKYGVPTGYRMTWVVENEKATIKPDDRALLARITGDQLEVRPTRMVDRELPGGWAERHGTPWGPKALIESSFRVLHDQGGSLPGQTGSLRVLNEPADLTAKIEEHKALAAELEGLPPEIVAHVRSAFLTNTEAIATIEALMAKINARHNHQLQGFEKIQYWRFPEDVDWRPLDELRRYGTADLRRVIMHPGRLESPLERMERLLRQVPGFLPVPEDALIPFIARTVKRVSHPAPYTIRWTEDGVEQLYRGELPELARGDGGPFSVKILPHNLAIAYVYDEAGRRLGAVARVHAPSPLDDEGMKHAFGELNHFRALVTKPVLERHAAEAEANEARRAQNTAIIAAAREGRSMVEQGQQAEQTRKADTAASRRQNLARQRALAAAAKATLSQS